MCIHCITMCVMYCTAPKRFVLSRGDLQEMIQILYFLPSLFQMTLSLQFVRTSRSTRSTVRCVRHSCSKAQQRWRRFWKPDLRPSSSVIPAFTEVRPSAATQLTSLSAVESVCTACSLLLQAAGGHTGVTACAAGTHAPADNQACSLHNDKDDDDGDNNE